MQEYKHKAIKELEYLLVKLKLLEMADRKRKFSSNGPQYIEDIISVLKGEYKETKIIEYCCVIPTVLEVLTLPDNEKMQICFDLLRPVYKNLDAEVNFFYAFFASLSKIGISMEEFQNWFEKAQNMEDLEEIIKIERPKKAELIIGKMNKSREEGKKLNQAYRVIKDLVEDENRKPTKESLPKIKEALNIILYDKELEEILIRELTKVSKNTSSKIQYIASPKERPNYNNNFDLTIKKRKVMTDREWVLHEKRIQELYDLPSNMPRKELDLLEKCELIKLLRISSYKEEEIAKMLWEVDYISHNRITSTPEDKMRTGIILNELRKKALFKISNPKIPVSIAEIYTEYQTSSEEEREIWKELLKSEIDLENTKYTQELHRIHTEIKSITCHQYQFWKETLLQEIEYKKHLGCSLIPMILLMIKNSKSKEEKTEWKLRLIQTFERIHLEQLGNNEYEIENTMRIRKKDYE